MNPFDLLLYLVFLPSVDLFEVELQCPNFMEKENTVTCRINKTAFSCPSSTEHVMFDRTVNGTTQTLCHTENPVCKKQNYSNVMCWCDESSQGMFTYVFRYVATRNKDLGALLECKYCQDAEETPNVNVIGNCKNISFDAVASGGHVFHLSLGLLAVVLGVC